MCVLYAVKNYDQIETNNVYYYFYLEVRSQEVRKYFTGACNSNNIISSSSRGIAIGVNSSAASVYNNAT